MNNKKGTGISQYTEADATCVYDSFHTYICDDFMKSSFPHLLRIAKMLRVWSAKQFSMCALIDALVQKHKDQLHSLSNDEIKEYEESKDDEEKKEQEETSIVEKLSKEVYDALSFTEQLKQKFMEIRHHKMDVNIWFHANSVYNSVDSCDKIRYEDLISRIRDTRPDYFWEFAP